MMSQNPLSQESYFIRVTQTDTLHLKRIYKNPDGIPVFMLHGAIENGRIFYSDSGRGLASFLANEGYDVYIADLRGHGLSKPRVSQKSTYGQTENITEDIPAFINQIVRIRGEVSQHWIAHSWGGVLLSSYLARFNRHRRLVRSMAYFGVKRNVRVWNLHRLFKIDLIWKGFCGLLVKFYGYLPAKKYGIGSDNESAKSHRQSKLWVKRSSWRDTDDHFDYGETLSNFSLPPTLYLSGLNDRCLGHPKDVRDFINESGKHVSKELILSKSNGNRHDYDHISMLTHKDAVDDHFLAVLEWLRQNER
ncbi:MAG: alpha/beta fold hydrolase [Calditrichaceae bacterium]